MCVDAVQIMSKRGYRRQRTRDRIARQQVADAEVLKQCDHDFNLAVETFSGTACSDCKKPVPPRALFSSTGWYGNVHLVGCGIRPEFCHKDRDRCKAEARAYWGKMYKNFDVAI